ncbi:ABC transporter ATP-binding protein [Lagierella sp.]|uniref:ABC transporter ATP-binding protein n=1 Tax=Lagierella sp. TaxID=2849657 RepID=UPI002618083D|nr:ABC transporter ATP-binding protein [Lagierella sp.]
METKDNLNKEVLKVEDLSISFYTPVGEVKAVDSICYSLHENEIMGIVGESGSGKSVESYGIMGLLQSPGKVKKGKILYKGKNVLDFDKNQMRQFRGADCSMIFQNPMTCLNPVYTIGNQLMEAVLVHKKISKDEAYKKAVRMLELVGISNPERRMKQYPHELSGGMRQRVMIGMGLICEPDILIADEPTTALDVTIQAQILELIKRVQMKNKMSVIFITHNLAVVAQICDTVSVMYAGRIVEQGTVDKIFYNPSHPYTKGLLKSMPRIDDKDANRLESIEGTPVDMLNPPEGCGFSTRCEHCMNICLRKEPPMVEVEKGHRSKCFLHIKEVVNGR